MTRVFIALFLVVASTPLARAQPASAPPTLAEVRAQLDALRAQVDAMTGDAARTESMRQSMSDLTARVEALSQRIEVLAAEQQSMPDAKARIDELAAEASRLSDDLGALRDRVQALETTGAVGGGGLNFTSRNNRLVFRSADGRLSFEPFFFIQTRAQLDATGGYDDVEALELRLRRIRFGFWGHVGDPDLTFHLNLDPVDEPALLDTFVQYRVADELSVRLGQTRVPFARGWLTEPFRFLFPARALATRTFRYDRDVQLTLLGEFFDGRLGYRVSAGNGAGYNRRNQNTELMASGRVEVAVLGDRLEVLEEGDRDYHDDPYLALAVAANHNLVPLADEIAGIDVVNDVDGDGDTDNVRVVSAGAEAQFKWRGLAVEGEYFVRRESYGTILAANPELREALDLLDGDDATGAGAPGDDDSRVFQGFYAQASYFVLPRRLAVGSRVGWSNQLLLPFAGRNVLTAPPANYGVLEVDAVVQLYWDRAGGRFLGVQYTYFDGAAETGVDAVDSHRVLIESQFSF